MKIDKKSVIVSLVRSYFLFIIQIGLICILAKHRPNYSVAIAAIAAVAAASLLSVDETLISSIFHEKKNEIDKKISIDDQVKSLLKANQGDYSECFLPRVARVWIFWNCICSCSIHVLTQFFLSLFLHSSTLSLPRSHFPFLSCSKVPTAHRSFKCANYMELSNWTCQAYTCQSSASVCTHVNSNH